MSKSPDVEEFIRQYAACEVRLRAYIVSLVPRWGDADEIMQRCSVVMWRKIGHFKRGTNFFAWACQIARLEVKDYRKRQLRERRLFSDAFVDLVADEAAAMEGELSRRHEALETCLGKLSDQNRELLRLRYDRGLSVVDIAGALLRSVEAVYKSLDRVRHSLHDCINKRIAAGDA